MMEEKKEEKQEPAKEEKPPESEGPPPAPERARGMLAMKEEQRIETLWEAGVELIKELITLKDFDSVLNLVNCIVEHASNISPHHRLKGAKLMSMVYPLFRPDELQQVRGIIEGRLLAAVMLERDRTVYPVLVELAADSIESLIVHNQMEQAAPLMESLRNEMLGENKDYPDRREISSKGLEKVVAGRGFPVILDKIRAKVNIATRMVEWIGLPAARGVIERMRTSDSVAERMDLAQLILKAGPDAGSMLADEALNVKAPSEALKLLDLIPHAMNETQAEASLGMLLRHPALAVRRRAASFLGGRGYPRAGTHLVDALRKESDPSARGLFVETLGLLKFDAGLATLGQILESRSESDDVRCLAAAALGNIAKPQAIPILTRAAAKGKGFTLVLNAAPTVVRAAAVRALANFSRYPETRDAIRRSQDDPDAPVRDAAREALLTPMIKAFGDPVKKAALVTDIEQIANFSDGGVTGLLSEVPLDQICQLLDEGARTGLLMVHVGGANAEVYIEKGDVVSAEYNGLRGKPAFVQFCRWEGTYFLFVPGVKPQKPGPPTSLMRILLEACDVEGNTAVRRRPEKRK